MEIETKFNIGDTVYINENDTIYESIIDEAEIKIDTFETIDVLYLLKYSEGEGYYYEEDLFLIGKEDLEKKESQIVKLKPKTESK